MPYFQNIKRNISLKVGFSGLLIVIFIFIISQCVISIYATGKIYEKSYIIQNEHFANLTIIQKLTESLNDIAIEEKNIILFSQAEQKLTFQRTINEQFEFIDNKLDEIGQSLNETKISKTFDRLLSEIDKF